MAENRVELITLDRDIGDGDHGENMDRGFQAVVPKLDDLPADATPGDVFKLVATTLISTVGGAAGPALRNGLPEGRARGRRRGHGSTGRARARAATAARDGIVLRGKAEPGDKTMIDAWTPAVDAAEAAVRRMAPMRCDARRRRGRRRRPARWPPSRSSPARGAPAISGERAIGHRDPGAQSTALLLRAAAEHRGPGLTAGAAASGTSRPRLRLAQRQDRRGLVELAAADGAERAVGRGRRHR